jgi:hypothetical protein
MNFLMSPNVNILNIEWILNIVTIVASVNSIKSIIKYQYSSSKIKKIQYL